MRWKDPLSLEKLLDSSSVLGVGFYSRGAIEVARDLLGTVLVRGRTAGRIVEVEAYLGLDDLAAHASRGITNRTRVLFGPPGHAYVYLIYGMYECLNIVAEPAGSAGCVLIRALEPVCGLEKMRARRPAARKPEQLCSGPGKLTLAMGITRELNGAPVTRGELTVRAQGEPEPFDIAVSPRIGINECVDWPLRFYVADSAFVSKAR